MPGRHSCRSKPASRANLSTRSDLALRPPENVTTDDMLSVSHSSGTPPRDLTTAVKQASRSSVVLVREYTNLWSLEQPSVAVNTLNSNSSPRRLLMLRDSFQSNCSWRPGGVSKRGWGSGPPGSLKAMPRVRQ